MAQEPNLPIIAFGSVLLLLWVFILRPVDFEYADGNVDDGPELDAIPWNTMVRTPVYWSHNETSGVLGACSHGACPVSLRTNDESNTPWVGVLYWRLPWASSGSEPVDIPREVKTDLHDFEDEDLIPAVVPHYVGRAEYHERDPALDFGLVAVGLLLLRLGFGGDRARSAGVAWAATVPFAPFVAPFQFTILTPLFPSLFLVVLALGIRWTWQRPRVRHASNTLLEAAAVLGAVGLAMFPYFTVAPLA